MAGTDSAVKRIAALVKAAGGRALLVGGAVRDRLLAGGAGVSPVLCAPPKDLDLEVFGLAPDRLEAVVGAEFEFDPCGKAFGVLKVKHHAIDIALPRRESKRGLGHKGFLIDSDPFLSVREAASRRDFTINAMYMDPLTGALEDPWNGREDLAHHVLRHVSPKFAEDPLRVLRGMQFVARFGLVPAPETVALCRTMTMEDLPPERLFEEWSKFLLKGTAMSAGLDFLRATDWVRYFPELARLIGCEQDPEWHPEGDVWNHTCLCLDAFARHRTGQEEDDGVVGLATLCHDFGKPDTTRFDPRKHRLRSLGHDVAGEKPTLSFLRRLTNEERILREVPPLVMNHMAPFAFWKSHATDAAVRRLALKVVRLDRLIRVCQADAEGRGGKFAAEPQPELDWLAARAEALRVADSAPKPILLGRHLLAHGVKAGPAMGQLLAKAFEAQLDGAFADLEGAYRYMGWEADK